MPESGIIVPLTDICWLSGVQHTQAGAHWITVAPDFLAGS
ncbi:hypothetical protein KPSA1_04205 [Pseudomonas syringae pv. actinidiae]|uniref:Uncharacterized protein n=1 Tax=Pseudomonas syringae pv. actinidiae TaxID=103796 RepID=A0A2V0QCW8_PSESF|nr:hypothetical protein KPSA1_04205 [Pseudomonas syringae pv. actinidiae]